MKKFGFSKDEKLKHKKDIDLLFKKGKWKTCGSLRVIILKQPSTLEQTELGSKVGVSVSKRYFKRAVDRNRIKRLLREVYRHHKATYHEKFGEPVLTMIFWVSPVLPTSYAELEKDFLLLCKK